MALCVGRVVGEEVVIVVPGLPPITIRVDKLRVDGRNVLGKVTLAIVAPKSVEIDRKEIYEQKQAKLKPPP